MSTRTPPRKRGRKPGLTPAKREARDNLIIDLYLAGWTQRDIAAHPRVDLGIWRVNQIIKEELRKATQDHLLASQNAMTIYVARLERLVREAFAKAKQGDLKAVEVARRLLRDQADLYELAEGHLPIPPMSDTELDAGEPVTELERYRARREERAAP